MKKYFVLETLDDVIIGSSNAAAFSAQTLDYIPGSAVMGAVCSLYGRGDLAADTLNLFFQENMTVFSDFLPLTKEGEETRPAPMSFHYEKRKTNAPFLNFLKEGVKDETKQYKQVRGDNRTSGFAQFSPDKAVTARTAIDYETNTAKTSALYNRDAIAAGQLFLGCCSIPDTLENGRGSGNDSRSGDKIAAARAAVFDILKDGSILRIGAGRGSEYGRARVHDVTAAMEDLNKAKGLPDPGTPVNGKRKLVLWCLSNAEFLDAVTSYDSPVPDNPAMLWALARENIAPVFQPGSSFVRTGKTRYYNNARGGLDSARVFVARGSVLVYEYEYSGDEARLPAILGALQEEGCGLSRQMGFGRIMVNPECLVSQGELKDGARLFASGFKYAAAGASRSAQDSSGDAREAREVQWLKEMAAARLFSAEIEDLAGKLLKRILDIYLSARKYLGIGKDTDIGPGTTQWQSLRSALCSLSSCKASREDILLKIREVAIGGKEENRGGKEMQEDDIWNVKFLYDSSHGAQAQAMVAERSFEECFSELVEDLISKDGKDPELALCALIRCFDLNFTLKDPRIYSDLDSLAKKSGQKKNAGNKKEEKR